MKPLYFGSSPRALFGVYHPPQARAPLGRGVVLCYPMGQEYMRAHRAFRQVAMMLSRRGFHVFRFDYYGTGDSAGDGDESSVAQWIEDVGTAVDELKDTAGLARVSLVGLRLGAALATLTAARRRDIDALVLWTPVVDGKAYVDELLSIAHGAAAHGAPAAAGDPIVNVLGFPLGPQLEAELRGIDLGATSGVTCDRATLLVSEQDARYDRLVEALRASGVKAGARLLPSTGNWSEVDNWGSALIPHALIQGVVDFLGEAEAA
jgi:pimeloyl-ACP methyl ester carboxylesterase